MDANAITLLKNKEYIQFSIKSVNHLEWKNQHIYSKPWN